jgi:hypothetical protein
MESLRTYVIASALACAVPAAWADDPPAATPPSSQAQQSSHSSSSSSAPKQGLDLRTPDVHKVMPADELEAAVNAPDEDQADQPQDVPVSGEKPAPVVPGGIAAVWWGITHPTQIWRVFAPVQ